MDNYNILKKKYYYIFIIIIFIIIFYTKQIKDFYFLQNQKIDFNNNDNFNSNKKINKLINGEIDTIDGLSIISNNKNINLINNINNINKFKNYKNKKIHKILYEKKLNLEKNNHQWFNPGRAYVYYFKKDDISYCLPGKNGHTYFTRLTEGISTAFQPNNNINFTKNNIFLLTNDNQEYQFTPEYIKAFNTTKKLNILIYRDIYDRVCSLWRHKIDSNRYLTKNHANSGFIKMRKCNCTQNDKFSDFVLNCLNCLQKSISETHKQGLICGSEFWDFDYILDYKKIFFEIYSDLSLDITWSSIGKKNDRICDWNNEVREEIKRIYIDDFLLIENNKHYFDNMDALLQDKDGKMIYDHLLSLKERWKDPQFKERKFQIWKERDIARRKKYEGR